MSDFFEIDFWSLDSDQSGDAISLRYQIDGVQFIHSVDGGFQKTAESIVKNIKKYYNDPSKIEHVVVTHPDGDHAGGVRTILEEFEIGELWMLRPWMYAEELIESFPKFSSIDNLKKRLREIYPNLSALEEIALKKGIPIREPFQSSEIGAFKVLAPSKDRYLECVIESEKTPEQSKSRVLASFGELGGAAVTTAKRLVNYVKSQWGEEVFSEEETSKENEMSVVQYAMLCDESILLTGDAGRAALSEAADYAEAIGISLPGIDRFQVPHHGSRRNVSTEILDRWLGERLPSKPEIDGRSFTAIFSAAKNDEHHPKKAVIRAMHHRGGKVVTNEKGEGLRTHFNAPPRVFRLESLNLGFQSQNEPLHRSS